MGRDDDGHRGGSHLFWFLCFLAVWLLIVCVVLVLRHGWKFPELG